MDTETHVKPVKGKLVLVPSLELLQRHLPKADGPINGNALRKSLLAGTEAVMVCPVTLRRHFKTLGLVTLPRKA